MADGTRTVRSYRDLRVWVAGMELAEACYRTTREFSREESFGMTSQIRRAAAAVPANIAEGYGRESSKELIRFLRIAQGSIKELETHLLLASRVEIAADESIVPLLDRCEVLGKMLRALIRSMNWNAKRPGGAEN